MTHSICYVSSATDNLNENEMDLLFNTVLHKNKGLNITGILLYYYGNFLQVLEGDEEALKSLFETIKKDKRHQNLITIYDKKNDHSIFDEYKTGFSIIKTENDLKNLKAYLKLSEDKEPLSTSVLGLLKPFLI
ncbi:BLUF domain-containing protein [Marixanthomonas sp. SCSIO 43207]|uniref:BLUF domain-containing protein n=1 Tax=Marixanthomonas sp. SCSIO 43207 TaxID=2779360 RepID=UPI001CA87027|nr:BLUF domain-containing protein [Marixanthomonas sp. SCSIO 43207]UAB81465.1 BLUF domain-containing protein [Marixanthomonas sp. SCSIO 43207]